MSHPQQTRSQRPAPRLYLITPQVDDAAGFARDLAAALGAADIAAVLLRLSDADERTQIERVRALTGVAQDEGVALLVEGDGDFAVRGGADGAHLNGFEAFSAALGVLKPDRIAGCGGLATRHDAMLAAENGADYVMFGDTVDGRRPPFDTIVERVAWWAEVFEIPCVALAAHLDEIGPLVSAGAEFIAVGDFVWSDARGAAAMLAETAERLAVPEAVT